MYNFCFVYFQARLPAFQPNVSPDEMPEQLEEVEDITWCPQVLVDTDLVMYLRAARLVQYIVIQILNIIRSRHGSF